MNFGELKARIKGDLHRSNLPDATVAGWVEDARQKIQNRFTIELAPFTADTDTNPVLTGAQNLYILAALAAGALWQRDDAGNQMYLSLFTAECDSTAMGTLIPELDSWTDANGNPPVVGRA
jgi:hypothetical protein